MFHSLRICFYIQLLIIFSMTSLSAFASTEVKNEKNYREPDLKVKRVQVEAIHLTTADMEITIEIFNPNSALTISDLSFQISLNNLESAKGHYKDEINIPSNGSISLILPLTVDMTALPGVGINGILGGVQLNYEINAEFDASVLIFKKRVKKKLKGNVPVQSMLPQIILPRIQIPEIFLP